MTTTPSCGLVGCSISEKLQEVVEQGYRLLPGGSAPAPPPPDPEPWWQSPWLLAAAFVLLAGAVAVIVWRSERAQALLRNATRSATTHARPAATLAATSVRRQAQPAQVVRWAGPLGHLTMRGALATCRWIARGKGWKGTALRAAVPAFVVLYAVVTPFGVAMLPLSLVALLPLWVFLFVGLVVAVVVVARRADGDQDTRGWWSERKLLTALRSAGIVPALRADEPEVSLRRRGAPQHSEHGVAVTFELPGQPWTLVRDRADRLAAALRLDGDRLHVSHPEGTPTGTVRLFVGNPQREGSTAAEVGSAERTSWSEPVRIGMDPQGQPVHLQTSEQNTLLAGQPGAGKTSVARIVLGHYLMDSAALVYGLDGKGARADYGAAAPLCAGWVWGTADDAVEAVEAMLTTVLGIVRTRNSTDVEPEGGWPGVLLLLEELQDVRAAADKATRDRLDNLLGRCVRMGRSVGVSVLVSTQRPSVDDLPAGVRNLVSQRLALMLRNGADAALVLGTTPTLPLPARRGQALLTTPTGTVAVALDLLDSAAWQSLCSRAAALRAYTVTDPAGEQRSPWARPVEVEVDVQSPVEVEVDVELHAADRVYAAPSELIAEVVRLLDAEPRGLSASELLAQVPADIHDHLAPAALGRELARHPDWVTPGFRKGEGRVWRCVDPAVDRPAAGVDPAVDRPVVAGHLAVDLAPVNGSNGTIHAHGGASVTQSPESPAGAR